MTDWEDGAAGAAVRAGGRALGLKGAAIVGGIGLLLLLLVFAPLAVVAATAGSSAPSTAAPTSAPITGDARAIAQGLMASGKLRTLPNNPDHIREIQWIADGQSVPDCGVDIRVLQLLALLVQHFQSVGVSDINRKCTGQIEGAGTSSAHWVNGGGHAVDLWELNGVPLTGRDSLSLEAIALVDPHMPTGARVGQAECGAAPSLAHLRPFDDTCNHLHLDFLYADGGVS